MLIQKIRENKKKMKWPLIIVVGLLCVSLVAGFAVNNSSHKSNKQDGTTATIEETIANTESSLNTYKTQLSEKPNDYTTLMYLGEVSQNLATYYLQASYEAEKYQTMATESAGYYEQALKNAPAELNDLGKAKIYTSMAISYYYADKVDVALGYFQDAIKIVPTDFETNMQFATFLYMTSGPMSGVAALEAYKPNIPADDTTGIAEYVDQQIKGWTEYYNEMKKAEEAGKDGATTGGTDVPATPDTAGTTDTPKTK